MLWIKTSKQSPTKKAGYLIFSKGGEIQLAYFNPDVIGGLKWDDGHYNTLFNPDWWMELPNKPTTRNKKQ